MAFNLDDYEPVEKRITDFWAKYPNGRIHTVIVSLDDKQVIIRAEIFTDREDHRPVTVDHAKEKIGGTGMMANSWLEVCCTSAIGRALADLDFAKKAKPGEKSKRPSREEMIIATRAETPAPKAETTKPADYFMAQAFEARQKKDIDKLRAIYAEAAADNQDKSVLDSLTELAKEIQ
jgi:hypothetical protein